MIIKDLRRDSAPEISNLRIGTPLKILKGEIDARAGIVGIEYEFGKPMKKLIGIQNVDHSGYGLQHILHQYPDVI